MASSSALTDTLPTAKQHHRHYYYYQQQQQLKHLNAAVVASTPTLLLKVGLAHPTLLLQVPTPLTRPRKLTQQRTLATMLAWVDVSYPKVEGG